MNRWYSKDGKTMVNLDNVTSFKYYDMDDVERYSNPHGGGAPQYINEVKQHQHFIILREGGYEFTFRGVDAFEIYNILRRQKQVL